MKLVGECDKADQPLEHVSGVKIFASEGVCFPAVAHSLDYMHTQRLHEEPFVCRKNVDLCKSTTTTVYFQH